MKKKKRNKTTVAEAGHRGGTTTRDRYGSEHFSEIAKKSAQSKLERDPDYFKKIRAIGIKKQQDKKREEQKPVNRFLKAITGE